MHRRPLKTVPAALLVSTLTWPATVHAQSIFGPIEDIYDSIAEGLFEAWPDEFESGEMKATLGVGTAYTPRYQGGDRYKVSVVPLLRVAYEDFATLQNTRLRINLLQYENITVGPTIRYAFGRSASNDPVLEGWGKIGDTVELGVFLRYTINKLHITLEYREGLSNGRGAITHLTFAHGLYQDERTRVLATASTSWGSGEKLQTTFGITPQQADRAVMDLPAYNAGSGIYEVSSLLGAEYALTGNWFAGAVLGYTRLLADAADSPIVSELGSANQFTLGTGLLYRF